MKDAILAALSQQIDSLKSQGILPADLHPQLRLDRTKDKAHGDWASNLALLVAKPAGKNPRQMAELLVQGLGEIAGVSRMDIAGPGFINFFVDAQAKSQVIAQVLDVGHGFASNQVTEKQKILLEYVSANPTGPLHVGHGRGAAYGGALASLLKKAGHEVHQEYYVNDAGRQMDILGTSVFLRYLELLGEAVTFPRNGYQGDYIWDIARDVKAQHGNAFHQAWDKVIAGVHADEGQENGDKEAHIDGLIAQAKTLLGNHYAMFFDAALNEILGDIQQDLGEFRVKFDTYFSEKSLMTSGDIDQALTKLKQAGWIEERDGALWFLSSRYGDEKDRVVVRDNGQSTYFASDLAYHLNKIQRGYDRLINIWGADHHGYISRVKAGMHAMGLNENQLTILLVQFANLFRGGEKISMSTRSGEFVTLRQLREEVGTDAARYFYVARKSEQHMDFDLDLAKSQSNDNPVYYIQYAHARICAVQRGARDKGFDANPMPGLVHLGLLQAEQEDALITQIARYPEVIALAARDYEPHQVANYLKDLAQAFHGYYNAHSFLVDDTALRQARLSLIEACRIVLADGLQLLGLSAPESM